MLENSIQSIIFIPVNVLFKLLAAIYLESWLCYLTLFTVNVQGLMSWKVKYIIMERYFMWLRNKLLQSLYEDPGRYC